jgi:hypothetical protein
MNPKLIYTTNGWILVRSESEENAQLQKCVAEKRGAIVWSIDGESLFPAFVDSFKKR